MHYINIQSAANPRATKWGGVLLDVTIENVDGVKEFHAIPTDTEEHGRDLYQWAMDGEFGPIAMYVAPTLTFEEKKSVIVNSIQGMMDQAAKEKGYDDIKSAVTYVDDDDPVFDAEGRAFKSWRSSVWRTCYRILADVESGNRPEPTTAELLAELPKLILE